jgi:hypothetical protein
MLTKPPQPKGKLDTVTVNGPEDVPEWDAIDWRVHEGNVGRLRRRIFKATREQDWAAVRSLQKLMLRSWSNTLVSVRHHPAQHRTPNGGDRWAGRAVVAGSDGHGRAGARHDLFLGSPAGAARVYTEVRQSCQAAVRLLTPVTPIRPSEAFLRL